METLVHKLLEWAWFAVLALVGVIWSVNRSELMSIKLELDKKADQKDLAEHKVELRELRSEVSNGLSDIKAMIANNHIVIIEKLANKQDRS